MATKTDPIRRVSLSKKGSRAPVSASPESDGHLYLQVARALREDIVSGVYPVGSQLPTEDMLTARFSVSRYTVREALRRLREENLVASRQGAGTIVAPHPSDSHVHHVMSINDLVTYAAGMRFAISSIKMMAIDKRHSQRTGIASGEEWLVVYGFRYEPGEEHPICLTEYYINREFAAVGRLLPRHTGPIFPLIEDMFGQSIVEVEQEISAGLVTLGMIDGLKVKPGTAVLEVRRTYKVAKGKVAQVTINTHPASRFRHSMTMRRVKP
jgi:DNA-binding GntR family transcriptional regulator